MKLKMPKYIKNSSNTEKKTFIENVPHYYAGVSESI